MSDHGEPFTLDQIEALVELNRFHEGLNETTCARLLAAARRDAVPQALTDERISAVMQILADGRRRDSSLLSIAGRLVAEFCRLNENAQLRDELKKANAANQSLYESLSKTRAAYDLAHHALEGLAAFISDAEEQIADRRFDQGSPKGSRAVKLFMTYGHVQNAVMALEVLKKLEPLPW